jgi:hypothetical protein
MFRVKILLLQTLKLIRKYAELSLMAIITLKTRTKLLASSLLEIATKLGVYS